MTTASQKAAALVTPVALVWLAALTSGPGWSDPGRTQGSWKEVLHPAAAGEGTAAAAAPEAKPTTPPPLRPEPEKKPAPKHKESHLPSDPTPAPPPSEAPAPEPAAAEGPPEIEIRTSGLPRYAAARPLTVPASGRLDVIVGATGDLRVDGKFLDPETALKQVTSTEKKEAGLLFVIADSRSPWDPVRDLLKAAADAGWTRIALAAESPDKPGIGRLLDVPLPAGDPVEEEVPITPIRVLSGGREQAFTVNGEKFETADAMAERIRNLHKEYEGFAAGYAEKGEKSPWVVDGAGATTGGVVMALDTLHGAGVKTARLAGVQKEKAE